jgi:hypothetical protein
MGIAMSWTLRRCDTEIRKQNGHSELWGMKKNVSPDVPKPSCFVNKEADPCSEMLSHFTARESAQVA